MRPIPEQYGVGFTSYERKPEYADTYHEVQEGRYWNYFFTANNFNFPKIEYKQTTPITIDGFSPNLNKSLHVGHLRQVALACSLTRILYHHTPCRIVSLLGASQGVLSTAVAEYDNWCKFLNYKPELFYDVLQPIDYVECRPAEKKDNEHFDKPPTNCKIFDGPKGPVIVVRSDGRPTYGFYDLAFAKNVNPTHYITGDEQAGHWAGLGFSSKHLPMGLVLGKDGKKMKSRTGDSPSAKDIINQIVERLDKTPDPDKLAWNVVAWNFLHTARAHTVRFDPENWTEPDQPGLYITYTYARLISALGSIEGNPIDLIDFDVELLGISSYYAYYEEKAVSGMDSAPLANFAQSLAKKLNVAYHKEKIQGGRQGFQYAVSKTTAVLKHVMVLLGMFPLERV